MDTRKKFKDLVSAVALVATMCAGLPTKAMAELTYEQCYRNCLGLPNAGGPQCAKDCQATTQNNSTSSSSTPPQHTSGTTVSQGGSFDDCMREIHDEAACSSAAAGTSSPQTTVTNTNPAVPPTNSPPSPDAGYNKCVAAGEAESYCEQFRAKPATPASVIVPTNGKSGEAAVNDAKQPAKKSDVEQRAQGRAECNDMDTQVCEESVKAADEHCNGKDALEKMSSTALRGTDWSQFGKDAMGACKAKLAQAGAGALYGVGRMAYCEHAISACKQSCDPNSKKYAGECSDRCGVTNTTCIAACQECVKGQLEQGQKTCGGYLADGALLSGGTAATSGQMAFEAKTCERLVASDPTNPANCKNGKDKDNALCPNYCKYNDNKTQDQCVLQHCQSLAGRDDKTCQPMYCYYHFTDKETCAGGLPVPVPTIPPPTAPPPTIVGAGPGTIPLPTNLGLNSQLPEGDVSPVPGRVVGNNGISDLTPGGGLGGAGANPAAASGAPAVPEGKGKGFDTNIDKGFNGSGGGGSGYSVSGVGLEGGGGGGRGGYGSGGKEGEIDLNKFLPGANGRNPAGGAGDLAAQGITGANDLSNFEKVSRTLSRKRTVLKPGEGDSDRRR